MTRWKRAVGQLVQSAKRDCGWRSRLLGVITTSGLRQRRSACRRKQMKVLRRRGRMDDLDVVLGGQRRNRSSRALECSGPCPRSRAAAAAPGRESRRHLSSALAMNWSMITCAALTKSPNCASQITSAVGAIQAVAVLKAQHARLGQRAVEDFHRRLVGCDRCCSGV